MADIKRKMNKMENKAHELKGKAEERTKQMKKKAENRSINEE